MIFDRLSIFIRSPAVQLLKKAAVPAGGCVLCAADTDEVVCADCARALPVVGAACPRCALPMAVPETCGACLRHPPALDATSATFQYRFPLDRLVRRFKFAGDLATGRWLGTALARAVDTSVLPDLLVAAPLTPARLRSRGFNQAVEIARVVAATHRVRFELGAIDKVRDTPAQRALNREERQANLQGAFRVRRPMRVAHVGIVDDVMTTGATADAMACALKEAGARRVSAWVVARTPEPGR